MTGRVLISGASIAGPALAYWLNRYGFQTTVVERAPAARTSGQNIDIRGAAREVVRRAGLDAAVKAATTGELGTRFVRGDGSVVAEFAAGGSDSDGATAEVEILRGDLSDILVEATRPGTEYLYGTTIVALTEQPDAVLVGFSDGTEREFDLVVAADGIGSSTRDLVLGPEAKIVSLGLEMTYLTIPRVESDVDWWLWFNAPGGRGLTLRPDRHGTTRAVFSVSSRGRDTFPAPERRGADRRTAEQQRTFLHDQFDDIGWQAPRMLAALDDTEDIYYESIGQVHAPRWSTGRFALLGDAAWCASPVSGMGTSLSLVGAYVLAGELAADPDPATAFRRYESIMRPYVDQAQDLPPGTPQVANPQTKAGVNAFRLALQIGTTALGRAVSGRLFAPPAEAIELPDYGHLTSGRSR